MKKLIICILMTIFIGGCESSEEKAYKKDMEKQSCMTKHLVDRKFDQCK